MLPPATPTVHVFSRCLMTSSGPPSWSIFGMVWLLAVPAHKPIVNPNATITTQQRMVCPPTTHAQPGAIFSEDYDRFGAACRPDCGLNLDVDVDDGLRSTCCADNSIHRWSAGLWRKLANLALGGSAARRVQLSNVYNDFHRVCPSI